MTNPFSSTGTPDRLDIRLRHDQLMIVKVWDVIEYVRTPTNKDGMVYIAGREPFPNRAVRAAVVDLGALGPDGQPGVLYPETWFQASSLMKEIGRWKGQLKLVTWRQSATPVDAYGHPAQTNPYSITDHSGSADAVAIANDYLTRHPEFNELQPPAPYDGKPPAPVGQPQYAPQQQQYPPQGYQQGPPPQQPPWQSPQQYPPAQPGYGGPPPQQQPTWQQPAPQWQPAPQQQPPAAWNTATPPPEYYAQQGPPPQQLPAQQPNTFYTAAQNHHGQPQPEQPPW